MTHVKVRAFMSPGDVLDIAAEASTAGDGTDRIMLTTRANGKNVATARLELSVKE